VAAFLNLDDNRINRNVLYVQYYKMFL